MKRSRWKEMLRLFVAALPLLVAPVMFGGNDGNVSRGFSPDKVYDVGEIDSINPFTGNLILQLPIGPAYPLRPGFSYQFVLAYNSSVWDYEARFGHQPGDDPDIPDKRLAVPESHSTAGFGWVFSLGQLFKPQPKTQFKEEHGWLYIAPDGARHEFSPAPGGEEYTVDGTYLRMQHGPNGSWHEVEFPDGTIRRFNADGQLTQLRDRFGNAVNVNVDNPLEWVITDTAAPGRVHKIHYVELYDFNRPNFDRLVSKVELKGPEGRTLTWEFHYLDGNPNEPGYQPTIIPPGGYSDYLPSEPSPAVPFLDHVVLPDGTQYKGRYLQGGEIHHLDLPTGAALDWTYGSYELSIDECNPVNFWTKFYSGVDTRRLTVDGVTSTWTWRRTIARKYAIPALIPTFCPSNSLNVPYPPDEFQSTLRDPHGVETTHYYAIYPEGATAGNNLFNVSAENGQPFSRRMTRGDLKLSTETLYCPSGPCPAAGTPEREAYVLRRTFVQYDDDGYDYVKRQRLNSRRIAERVESVRDDMADTQENDCGGAVCFVEERQDGFPNRDESFDGYGNFREKLVTTNFPGQQTRYTKTNYNPGSDSNGRIGGQPYFEPGEPWILGTYTDTTVASNAGQTPESASDFCFDMSTGFLKRTRVRRSAAGTTRDLITTFTDANNDGAIDERTTFGGDRLPGETGDPVPQSTWSCGESQSFGPVRSQERHTYSNGVLSKSQIAGAPFFSLDQTIDPSGAVLSSRDPDGLETTFDYDDPFGRMTDVDPPGDTPETKYVYTPRSGSSPAAVAVKTFPATGGSVLTDARTYFDGMGRPIQTRTMMPDGAWSAVVSRYDATGRLLTTSTPQAASGPEYSASLNPAQVTSVVYDALGRTIETTAPDDTKITRSYRIATPAQSGEGARVTTTTMPIATGENGAITSVPKIETYDGFGRLLSVTESLQSGNATTRYTYDLSGRLRGVSAGAQARSFVYDAAGLLTSETHPENGTSQYTYDVDSHVTTKSVGAERLHFFYDAAGRLLEVKDDRRNGLLLQSFKYDTAVDPDGQPMSAKGRLLKQVRTNDFGSDGRYVVADYFTYDTAGRLQRKETVVTDPAGSSARFTLPFEYHEDSSLPKRQNFPSCTGCTGAALPSRNVTLEWSAGMLKSVAAYTAINGITYHPNGGIHEVRHFNGATDVYGADPDGMSRPSEIRVTAARECALIDVPPSNETVLPGGSATLLVTLKDPGATVRWYRGFRGDTSTLVGSGTTLTLTDIRTTKQYWVRVEAANGGCVSDSATVTVGPCTITEILTPAAGDILYVSAPNTEVTTKVIVAAAGNVQYDWQANGVDLPGCRNLAECRFTPSAANTVYDLKVKVTGSCGDPVERVVRKIMLVDASCSPDVAASFPPEIPLLDDGSIELSVLMMDRSAAYKFLWYSDDSLIMTDDERNSAPETRGTSVLNITPGNGVTIRVEIARYCSIGPDVLSRSEIRKTFVWDADSCPSPKVVLNQTSVVLGAQNATRTFIAQSDWGALKYEWYRGDRGNTREKLTSDPGAPDKFTAPSAPGTYWVRAVSPCGTTWDSPTLVVSSATCEQPVRFAQQPASAVVHAGTPTTLRFDATSKPLPNSIKWYEGPGTSKLAGTTPTLTVAPIATTTYWVEVGNGCHTANSAYATLSVRTCSNISYSLAAREYEIRSGQSQLLSVTATANNNRALFYKWYRGRSGDTTNPLDAGEVPQKSVSPTETTQYWVRIHFSDPALCAVDSDEITVYVCNTPALKQPMGNMLSTVPYVPHWIAADSAGERLKFQWYIGAKGVKTNPLAPGLRMMRVAPAETTQYWVEITNDCRIGTDEVFQSDAITISVCPQNIAATAAHAEVMSGGTTTLSVTASGGGLKYKWYRGESGNINNPISGPEVMDPATITTPPITAGTSFWVRVYSGECFRNSDTITVGLCSRPTIGWTSGLTQVQANHSQTLQLTAEPANAMITYYKGPVGNVSASEVIGGPTPNRGVSVTTATTTTYWARATLEGTVCSATTPAFTVTVCMASITAQPQAAFFNSTTASSVTLNVTATAAQSYQWYIGDSGVTTNPVSGGTNASLSVAPSADTKYWVRVTGACGSPVDSTAALVTVCKAPAITATPASRVATSGAQVPLELTATGTGLAYQWYRGASGDTSTPISGATAASYTASQTVTTNYWVRVSGSCGSIDSSTIKLSVAPVITTWPQTQYINSGATATFSVVAAGTELSYRWYTGTTEVGQGSTYTTPALTSTTTYRVRVFSGEAYTDGGADAFVCQPKQIAVTQPASVSGSQVTLSVSGPDAAETYEWFVWTSATTSQQIGGGTSILVYPDRTTDYTLRTRRSTCYADRRITVSVCTPRITAHPQSVMVNSGQQITLTVAAVGTGPLTYQWYVGTSGNTSAPVSTSPTWTHDPDADYNIWVRVTSAGGCSVDSQTASVQVCKPPAIGVHPASTNVPANAPVTLSVNATGTDLSYQWYRGAAGVTSAPVGSNAATYPFTATSTEDYWVRITGRCGTINSSVARVSVPPTITAQPTNRNITRNTTTTFTVGASGNILTYQWYQGNTHVGNGQSYTTPALTQDTSYWVRVWSGGNYVDSGIAWAYICPGRAISVNQTSQSSGARVDLSVVGPSGNETYDWYAGTPGDPSKRVGGGTAVSVYPLETTTYYLRSSSGSCHGDTSVTVSVLYPTFTVQPQNRRINPGASTTLTASATGTPPLTYHWFNNGVEIGTGPSITVSPASTQFYLVRARSGAYSTDSIVVYVSVCVPPSITSQPPSAILYSTDTATLSVGTSGDVVAYQWYAGTSGNTSIPVGNGTNTLVTTPETTRSYWVRVIGECGSVDSATALLSVRPTITTQPADAVTCVNGQATLSIATAHTADSYLWYRVDGGTNTYIGSGTSISVTVPGAITVWCDVVSGNAHTASRMTSLTTRPGPAVNVTKTWLWEMTFRLQAHVPEEELPYAQYTWYRGPTGNVAGSQYYSEGYAVTVASSGTTETYWVRVTNSQTGCFTDRGINVPW